MKKILLTIAVLLAGGCGGQPPVRPSKSPAVSDTPAASISSTPEPSENPIQIIYPKPVTPPFYRVYKDKPDDEDVERLLTAAYFLNNGKYGCALIDIDWEMQRKLNLDPQWSFSYVTNFDNAYEVDAYMSTYISSSLYTPVEAANSLVKVFKVDGDLVWAQGAMGWGHYSFTMDGWYWYNETTLAAPFVLEDNLYTDAYVLFPLVRENIDWKVDRIIFPPEGVAERGTNVEELEEYERNREQDQEQNSDTGE